MVTIPFEIEQDGYKLVDALVLPDDHTYTEEQLEQLKLIRFYDWFELVTNPPTEEVVQDNLEE
jgi:hypothetical protein